MAGGGTRVRQEAGERQCRVGLGTREKCAAVESTNPVSLEPGGEQNTTEGDPMASAFLLPELPPNKPRGVGCGFSRFAAGSRVVTGPVPS